MYIISFSRFNILRVLLFIVILAFMSCIGKTDYKKVLADYVKEDIAVNTNRREFELSSLKYLAIERPREFELMYEEALAINAVVSEFESFLLRTENLDALNKRLRAFKGNIINLKLNHYRFLEKAYSFEPLTVLSDKYSLITKLKNLNFDRYNSILWRGCDLSGISSYKPKLLASRLNDSVIVLNIYSRLLREYNHIAEGPSLDVTINKKVKANTFIGWHIKPQTSSAAYLVKSRSDTLFVDAIIKTTNITKLIISKTSSHIVVGELKEFEDNYLENYFEKAYN